MAGNTAKGAIPIYAMKLFFIGIILTFNLMLLEAQNGFSNTYDLGSPGMSIWGFNRTNDTLLSFGSIFHDSIHNLQGLFFAKFDTCGAIISHHTAFDSTGGDYGIGSSRVILKLRDDSGFVTTAQRFKNSSGLLCFFNRDGAFTKIIEYPDPSSFNDTYGPVIEVETGLLVFGYKQKNNYINELFIMKTDKKGNKLWEKTYGSTNKQWAYNSHWVENENSISIGINTADLQGVPLSQWTSQSIVLNIDSLGNEQWRWESPMSLKETGVVGLRKRADGNWMYFGREVILDVPNTTFYTNTKIVVRDPDFNLVWEKIISPSYSLRSVLVDMQPTQDGNWIAVGTLLTEIVDWTVPSAYAGWMYKFSNNGDSIWSRIDTVFYSNVSLNEHFFYNFVQMDNGDIIAGGTIRVYDSAGKSFGWIMKVDKNGCLDTTNCIVSALPAYTNLPQDGIRLSPNPTRSSTYFMVEGNKFPERVDVIDISGQILQRIVNPKTNEIDLSLYARGIYLLNFFIGGKTISLKVIKT